MTINGNPDEARFVTIEGYSSIEEWATAVGITLEDALEDGVCADDGNDNIYVPCEAWHYLMALGVIQ
jgi:hypothetical protein